MCAKPISKLTPEEEERAMTVLHKSTVVEGLSYAPTLDDPKGYMERVRKSGVTATHITVARTEDNPRGAFKTIDGWYRMAENVGFDFALTTKDIIKAKKEGKVCVIMGSQSAVMIEDDLSLVRVFYQLGMRIIQLAYAEQNYIGSGGEDTDGGVSMFGRKVIAEMNKLGILVDVSHCGDKTVLDAIKYSEKPIAITHANPRKFNNHHRNKTDEQIIALAEKGGVIGLTAWTPISMVKKGVRPNVENFMDFVDYVVKLVGVDHVAFGLDLNPGWEYDSSGYYKWAKLYPSLAPESFEERIVEGLEKVEDVKNIARGLVARGYSDEDMMKILGGNLLALFQKVWQP